MDTTTDCDDDDAAIHPGAPEDCDGVDSDCDGSDGHGVITAVAADGTRTTWRTPAVALVSLEGDASLCGDFDLAGHEVQVDATATLTGADGPEGSILRSRVDGARLVASESASLTLESLTLADVAVESSGALYGQDLRLDPLPYARVWYTELIDAHIVAAEGSEPLIHVDGAPYAPFAPFMVDVELDGRGFDRTALYVEGVRNHPDEYVRPEDGALLMDGLEIHDFSQGIVVDHGDDPAGAWLEIHDAHLHDLGDPDIDGGALRVRAGAMHPNTTPTRGIRLIDSTVEHNVARTGAVGWVESGVLMLDGGSATNNTAMATDGTALRVEDLGVLKLLDVDLGSGPDENDPTDVSVGTTSVDHVGVTLSEHIGAAW